MWKTTEHQKIAESYEMKKTLGRGHFAVVKLAHHVVSGKKVAVKVIDKTKMDRISADHLYHEVTCMKLVQHPNVVRLYQVIETSSKLYLILELGDGGDMFDYIMRHDKGLSEDLAKEYFAQIVSAIAYCHKLHVVHRDLKPENVVFFERQGLVKLTDFGFSNRYRPGEKLSTSCGSLAYSAPEILLGEEYDAPAVDVWSLGVILYMLVCGVAPFNEANDSETLTNIMDCRYKVLDHVSEECQDLIRKMLIRDPLRRLPLDEIVNHPWLANAKSLQRARRNSLPILQRSSISDELHHRVMKTMIRAEIGTEEEILIALKEDRYDRITSTYFLLAERELQDSENGSSNANSSDDDISDDNDCESKNAVSDARPIPNKLRPMYPDKQTTRGTAAFLSISPPCNQAALLPPTSAVPSSSATTLEVSRHRTRSSSSEESNSSLSTSVERKSSSYIREHLTITPRHGFSVAHGGINALLEEEERSRSQTTTDEENDLSDDIGNMVNPSLLATQLQRSLQLKRFKKRKSAPVLNEICEETELENDLSEDSASRATGHHHSKVRHSISSSSPTSHIHHSHGKTKDKSAGDGKTSTSITTRPGRPLRRRRSQKSSSSETSDDDSGSRRQSSTNLSGAVDAILFRRRSDRKDDQDGDGDAGPGRLAGRSQVDDSLSAAGNTADAQKEIEDEDTDAPRNGSDASGGNDCAWRAPLLNNANQPATVFRKTLKTSDGSCNKIVNVFGVRSKSAESHTSSSIITGSRSSSSARSSCSSLCSSHRLRPLKRAGPWSQRNSSSTRSDTGLVLRYQKNNVAVRCACPSSSSAKISRSSSSSSFSSLPPAGSSLRVSNSLSCVGVRTCPVDPGADSDSGLQGSRRHRSCSLPRRHKRRKLACHKNAGEALGGDNPLPASLSESIEGLGAVARENTGVKRSNLSLASSTCSGSKFVVDPVNELPPSPCLTPLPESQGKEGSVDERFSFRRESRTKTLSFGKGQIPLNNTDGGLFSRPDADVKDMKLPRSVITKLNSWKAPRRRSGSNRGSVNDFSYQTKSEKRIVQKVKARDCCAIM